MLDETRVEQRLATKEEVLQTLTDNNVIAEFHIESLGEYCSVIDHITAIWRKKIAERQTQKKHPAPFYCGELSPWFRGVSKANYQPEPRLFRFYQRAVKDRYKGHINPLKIEETESYFFQRFKTFGTPFLKKEPKSDIEWHFLMRHHEVPSRLLDWSKGSFVALYFATRKSLESINDFQQYGTDIGQQKGKDAAVWMIEPRRLSEKCRNTRNICGSSNKEESFRVIDRYFTTGETTEVSDPIYPLPIIPDLIAPRIQAHIGRFTLHVRQDADRDFNSGGLMKFARDTHVEDGLSYLVKIVIPHKCHFSISRSLRSTGITDMNFTQDLDGLSGELSLRMHLGRTDHNRFVDELERE
ncbi:MAG: FRG domain-containing protein [Symploca sp. SIO2E6]|nr:FRG domain-containing protein [Symploca sp. SIO2E6]